MGVYGRKYKEPMFHNGLGSDRAQIRTYVELEGVRWRPVVMEFRHHRENNQLGGRARKYQNNTIQLPHSHREISQLTIFSYSTTVREAQRQRLCRAFPFEFWGLSNIFQQESGYFPQNLQFKNFSGRWLCRSLKSWRDRIFQTLFDKFLLCWWLRYSLNEPFWPLVPPLPAVCGVG
jgi:hypothetical protein